MTELYNFVCEICDDPMACLSGKYPCDLCGEFIGPAGMLLGASAPIVKEIEFSPEEDAP